MFYNGGSHSDGNKKSAILCTKCCNFALFCLDVKQLLLDVSNTQQQKTADVVGSVGQWSIWNQFCYKKKEIITNADIHRSV